MYHQIVNSKDPNCIIAFKEHLHYLQDNYPIILPGNPISKNTINICLTFDDAYFDFYYHIFPILRQQKIHATLGIPTGFIQETTNLSSKDRLAVSYPHGLDPNNQLRVPLCTWDEIKEMVASSYVMAASHGYNHVDLTIKGTNLIQELQDPKIILEKKLQTNINTIIYPFGKTSTSINKLARQYYTYAMRIGSASNINWQTRNGLLYRINADVLWQQNKPITTDLIRKIKCKYWINYLRNK
jgi:peptidoglycan/xylan/chitin deacetylase (PgdA/CDA1 family)